jgi:hypothetical protein
VADGQVRVTASPFAALIAVATAVCVLLLAFILGHYNGKSASPSNVTAGVQTPGPGDDGDNGEQTGPANGNNGPASPGAMEVGKTYIFVQTFSQLEHARETARILRDKGLDVTLRAIDRNGNDTYLIRTPHGYKWNDEDDRARGEAEIERFANALGEIVREHPGLVGYNPDRPQTRPYPFTRTH